MDRDFLAAELLKNFKSLRTEHMLNRLKLSFRGENIILLLLSESGGESTPGKLCEQVDFSAARLSAIIKSLESKGLVERVQNEDDKRSAIIALTADGYKHFMELQQQIIMNALTIIEKLGEDDVHELLRIMNSLAKIADETEEYEEI